MRSWLSLDPHSLAVCRILTGLTIVADLLWRSGQLRLHYTDQGVWPVPMLLQTNAEIVFPGVYLLAHGLGAVVCLFVLHGLAGFALVLGYRTQWATLLCWYLTRSLHTRQPWLLNGGDHLFAMLLLWALFLPWGLRWSLDERFAEPAAQESVMSSTRLVQAIFALQLPFVYWSAFFHKLEPDWLGGRALTLALNSNLFSRPQGTWLLAYPSLCLALNYAVMAWEAVGPFLLLSTRFRFRVVGALGFLTMHFGFLLFFRVGLFAWVPVLYLAALMPGSFWAPLVRGQRPWSAMLSWARQRRYSPSGTYSVFPETTPILVFLVVLGLVQTPSYKEPTLVPSSLRWVETATGMRQNWVMFTRLQDLADGWIVLEAELPGGQKVDLLRGGRPVVWYQPETLEGFAVHDRWAGYFWWLTQTEGPSRRVFVRAFLQRFGQPVRYLRLIFVRKVWLPDGRDEEPEKLVLWEGPSP